MTSKHDVIVIAGSLEGVNALIRLINVLPVAFPAVIVTAFHRATSADLRRFWSAVHASHSNLKVAYALHEQSPELGHLYIAPVDHHVVFAPSGAMRLIARTQREDEPLEADRLFESAAEAFGSRVIGVVLGGNGHAGTAGLVAITRAGGVRVVQSPAEAAHPAMPTHALLEDHVQFSVMLDRMGELLAQLVAHDGGKKKLGTGA